MSFASKNIIHPEYPELSETTETENLSILLCQIERKARRGEADPDDTLFLVGEVRRFMAESVSVCKAVNKLCTQIDKTLKIMKEGE